MANIIVTFGRTVDGRLEAGADARTEEIAIGADHEEGTLSATGGDGVVTIYAEADCYIAIGTAPDASNAIAGSNRRFIKEGWQRQYSVGTHQKVSVIQA